MEDMIQEWKAEARKRFAPLLGQHALDWICDQLGHAYAAGHSDGYMEGRMDAGKDDYCAGYRDAIRGDDPAFEDWNDDS